MTGIEFNRDGTRVIASYWRPARNRPGTDWCAWAAQWDLNSGRRTVVSDAGYPIAISADGGVVAMLSCQRSARSHDRRNAPWVAALWEFGSTEPLRTLSSGPEAPIIGLTFLPTGERIVGLTERGELLAWDAQRESAPTLMDKLDVSGLSSEFAGLPGQWKSTLRADSTRLIAAAPLTGGSDAGPGGVLALWTLGASDASPRRRRLIPLRPVEAENEPEAELRRWLSWPTEPLAIGIPTFLRYEPDPKAWLRNRTSWVALAPSQKLIAQQQEGMVLVWDTRGSTVLKVPGESPVAFAPDGTHIVIPDRRGILRFWNVRTGQITRSLRLDDRPSETFLAAAIQCESGFGEPAKNRSRFKELIESAASLGASVVVLPEGAVSGYMDHDLRETWQVPGRNVSEGLTVADPANVAEPVPGVSTRFFAQVAQQHGIYLTVPLLEVDPKTRRYYNSAVLLGPDGHILIHYRKLNPWPWAEQGWATQGNLGHPVADTPFGRLGVLICYDIHEQATAMADLRIDTLLYSVAWVEGPRDEWLLSNLPDIARKHRFAIVAANWTLPQGSIAPAWRGYGHSAIIDATGAVVGRAERDIGSAIVFAELPLPKTEDPP